MPDSAIFDESKTYRYSLTRYLDINGLIPGLLYKGRITFIMLNPSTADHEVNDPTVTKCILLSIKWGYSVLEVLNIFALRTKNPENLYRNRNPVGLSNDAHIIEGIESTDFIVCAWGNHGEYQDRGNIVREIIKLMDKQAHHLGLTKLDQPKHPLYLPNNSRPILWE